MFCFCNFIFKLKGLQHKISKLAINVLNKLHPLSRYKANSGKNKEKCLMEFDPGDRVFVLSN